MSRDAYETVEALVKARTWKAGAGMSSFDDERNYMGEDRSDWVVGLSRTRDSETLDNCNFEVALTRLQAAATDSDDVEVASFGHWACGWVEQIHVRVTAPAVVLEELRSILNSLADYPVLDDMAFSEAEHAAVDECFDNNTQELCNNLLKALGDPRRYSDLGPRTERQVEDAAQELLRADAGYRGEPDAWVRDSLDSLADCVSSCGSCDVSRNPFLRKVQMHAYMRRLRRRA